MIGAKAQETPTNGSAYYIYNADYDLFFTRGGAWGTQAYVSPVGIPWRVEITDGNYVLKMYDIYTQNTSADGGLGYNGSFTDNDSPIALTPSGDASNGFTLKNGDNYVTCPATKGAVTMTTTASKWKFLTQAQYEAVLVSRASTQEAAVAASKGIVIPGGNTLADVVSDVNAWTSTTTKYATPTKATWPISGNARNGKYNEGGYGVEMFETNDAHITKTISGLAKGVYKVAVRGMKRVGTNEGSVAMKTAGFYVSDAYMVANGNIIPVKSWAADNTANDVPNGPDAVVTIIDNGGYTTEGFVYVGDDGNLTLTLHNDAFWWGCWTVFNGVSYTFYNNEVSEEDATAILNQATDLESKAMLASTKTALTDAKTTFDGARTIANYNALNTAIENANASVAAYAPLGTKLSEAASVKSSVSGNAPSYVTTFDTNIGAITSDYNAGNYPESAISTQVAAVETEIIALVKSQTVAGSDMTRAVPNAACTGAAGDDNWKIENALASGEYFRLDTWAGTASGMSVPMIEYWITNGNTLSSNEMYQTITGLSNGVYRVTAETAVNNESNVAPDAGTALLFANNATTDITTGRTETSFKGQTGTFSVECVVSDGSLKLGLKAVSPNYNWIAFKNVQLTLVNLTVSKTISAAGWATYCSPYALDLANATGLTDAYIVTGGADGVLTKTSVKNGTVPANTGLLLKGAKGTATIPVVASSNTDVDGNILVGVTEATEIGAGTGWVLMGSPSLGFYQNANAFTVGANTAYIPVSVLPVPSSARAVFRLDDDATAIKAIEAADAENSVKDGKFLENGKIVIVKNGVKYSANGQILK